MTPQEAYQVLGCTRKDDDSDIMSKFRKLSLKYHPDKNGHLPEAEQLKNRDMFMKVAEAKETIMSTRTAPGSSATRAGVAHSHGYRKWMEENWSNVQKNFNYAAGNPQRGRQRAAPSAAAGERAAKMPRTNENNSAKTFSDMYSVLQDDREELMRCTQSSLQHACGLIGLSTNMDTKEKLVERILGGQKKKMEQEIKKLKEQERQRLAPKFLKKFLTLVGQEPRGVTSKHLSAQITRYLEQEELKSKAAKAKAAPKKGGQPVPPVKEEPGKDKVHKRRLVTERFVRRKVIVKTMRPKLKKDAEFIKCCGEFYTEWDDHRVDDTGLHWYFFRHTDSSGRDVKNAHSYDFDSWEETVKYCRKVDAKCFCDTGLAKKYIKKTPQPSNKFRSAWVNRGDSAGLWMRTDENEPARLPTAKECMATQEVEEELWKEERVQDFQEETESDAESSEDECGDTEEEKESLRRLIEVLKERGVGSSMDFKNSSVLTDEKVINLIKKHCPEIASEAKFKPHFDRICSKLLAEKEEREAASVKNVSGNREITFGPEGTLFIVPEERLQKWTLASLRAAGHVLNADVSEKAEKSVVLEAVIEKRRKDCDDFVAQAARSGSLARLPPGMLTMFLKNHGKAVPSNSGVPSIFKLCRQVLLTIELEKAPKEADGAANAEEPSASTSASADAAEDDAEESTQATQASSASHQKPPSDGSHFLPYLHMDHADVKTKSISVLKEMGAFLGKTKDISACFEKSDIVVCVLKAASQVRIPMVISAWKKRSLKNLPTSMLRVFLQDKTFFNDQAFVQALAEEKKIDSKEYYATAEAVKGFLAEDNPGSQGQEKEDQTADAEVGQGETDEEMMDDAEEAAAAAEEADEEEAAPASGQGRSSSDPGDVEIRQEETVDMD